MDLDFADVKPSVVSWVIVGLMSITFIVLLKWLLLRYPVPGLSEVMNTV